MNYLWKHNKQPKHNLKFSEIVRQCEFLTISYIGPLKRPSIQWSIKNKKHYSKCLTNYKIPQCKCQTRINTHTHTHKHLRTNTGELP